MLAGIMAGTLLVIGLGVILGYWLNFQHVFELLYVQTGMIWMSFLLPSAWSCSDLACCARHEVWTGSGDSTVEQQATRIYRTTLWYWLQQRLPPAWPDIVCPEDVLNESRTDMTHSLNAIARTSTRHLITVDNARWWRPEPLTQRRCSPFDRQR